VNKGRSISVAAYPNILLTCKALSRVKALPNDTPGRKMYNLSVLKCSHLGLVGLIPSRFFFVETKRSFIKHSDYNQHLAVVKRNFVDHSPKSHPACLRHA
jgi:hypothetical protein